MPAASSVHLLFHVGPVLYVLVEVADVAVDFVPGFEGEGYQRDEAEGEPLPMRQKKSQRLRQAMMGVGRSVPSLDDFAGEVTAVLALYCDVFVALEEGGEGYGALLAFLVPLRLCACAFTDYVCRK